MQRFAFLLLISAFSLNTLSAQDDFERLRDVGDSLDALIERVWAVDANSVEPSIWEDLQGMQNRLGAAQMELSILALMSWILDVGNQEALFENQEFLGFVSTLMQRLEQLFLQEETLNAFRTWIVEQMHVFFGEDTFNLQHLRVTEALNALAYRSFAVDPETGMRLTRFPGDAAVFFESYRTHDGMLGELCAHLIQAVAQSLFRLSAEVAFSAVKSPLISTLYDALMVIVHQLYDILGMQVPGIGSIQLGPRSLAELNRSDNDTAVQHPSPRSGPLSPRDNFDIPQRVEGLNIENVHVLYFHQRAASTGHSVLEF